MQKVLLALAWLAVFVSLSGPVYAEVELKSDWNRSERQLFLDRYASPFEENNKNKNVSPIYPHLGPSSMYFEFHTMLELKILRKTLQFLRGAK